MIQISLSCRDGSKRSARRGHKGAQFVRGTRANVAQLVLPDGWALTLKADTWRTLRRFEQRFEARRGAAQ